MATKYESKSDSQNTDQFFQKLIELYNKSFVNLEENSQIENLLLRELAEFHKKRFTDEQNSKFLKILKENKIALERLKNIVDNKLEDSFDFESLMKYLEKVKSQEVETKPQTVFDRYLEKILKIIKERDQEAEAAFCRLTEKHLDAFNLDNEQLAEVKRILKYNNLALERLKMIVSNRLESNYDFRELVRFLNKKKRDSEEHDTQVNRINYSFSEKERGALLDEIHERFVSGEIDFKLTIELYSAIKITYKDDANRYLQWMLREEDLTQLDDETLLWLLKKIDNGSLADALMNRQEVVEHIIDKFSFKEIIDLHARTKVNGYQSYDEIYSLMSDLDRDCILHQIFRNSQLLEYSIENNKLTRADLKYMIQRVDRDYEIESLCHVHNTTDSFIKRILKNFVLDEEDVEGLNRAIEKSRWFKKASISDIFDYIDFREKHGFYHAAKHVMTLDGGSTKIGTTWAKRKDPENIDKELLKLNKLNRIAVQFELNRFKFEPEQTQEIAEILKVNEIAQNRLRKILDSSLEDDYSFIALKTYLAKTSRGDLMNI